VYCNTVTAHIGMTVFAWHMQIISHANRFPENENDIEKILFIDSAQSTLTLDSAVLHSRCQIQL